MTGSSWIERLVRFGLASKEIVYIIVGVLAVQAATGPGGKTTDPQGVLTKIAEQPSNTFLLSLVAIGLIGYVLWRFVQAVMDPEHKGAEPKGIVQRLGFAISGLAYAGLALSAVQLALGWGGSNQNASKDWTARLLVQPFGRWFVNH